jgi:hypothetical protein
MDRSSRCCPILNNWYRYNYTQRVPPSETKPNVCLPLHYTISWHGEHRLNFCVDTDDLNSPMMIVPLLIVGPTGADDDEFPYKEWATKTSSLLQNGRTSGALQNCCILGRYIAICKCGSDLSMDRLSDLWLGKPASSSLVIDRHAISSQLSFWLVFLMVVYRTFVSWIGNENITPHTIVFHPTQFNDSTFGFLRLKEATSLDLRSAWRHHKKASSVLMML